jgi:hypothetical protein
VRQRPLRFSFYVLDALTSRRLQAFSQNVMAISVAGILRHNDTQIVGAVIKASASM